MEHNMPERTKKEKDLELLDEHVYYEFGMLLNGLEWLQNNPGDCYLRNAVIDSVAIHTRALIWFFGKSGGSDDVLSKKFGCNVDVKGEALVKSANKQVAHLTRARLANAKQDWSYKDTIGVLGVAIAKFCECAAAQSGRAADWRDLKNRAKQLQDREKRSRLRVDRWPDDPQQPCTTTSLSSPLVGGERFRRAPEQGTDTASGAAGGPAGGHGGSER